MLRASSQSAIRRLIDGGAAWPALAWRHRGGSINHRPARWRALGADRPARASNRHRRHHADNARMACAHGAFLPGAPSKQSLLSRRRS